MDVRLLPQQQMKASPALIALNSMLVLSTADLGRLVQRELKENPALDRVELPERRCPVCGRILASSVCLACTYAFDDAGYDDELDLPLVAAPLSLAERLRDELRGSLPQGDLPIIDYLIGALGEQGLLRTTVDKAARDLGVAPASVERVLGRLQEVAPAGVGARTVEECLLIQLDRLGRDGAGHPHAAAIVRGHWEDVEERRYDKIAHALGLARDQVLEACAFIRQHLRPLPLSAGEGQPAAQAAFPDTLIYECEGELRVELVESRRYALRLNPHYQRVARTARRGRQELAPEERARMQAHVSRARMFLTNLRQRRETIRRITEHLVARQEPFLRRGVRHLAPLTRAEVAAVLGLHESTVSRATAGKYVQIPSHEIIPYSHFFHASLSVKDVIQELIAKESRALTDEQIVRLLREQGYDLARRTVAKYRRQLGILPSHLR